MKCREARSIRPWLTRERRWSSNIVPNQGSNWVGRAVTRRQPCWDIGAHGAAFVMLNPARTRPGNSAATPGKLGLVLFAVVSPLALGIVYYGCITPVGWLMRLSGKD